MRNKWNHTTHSTNIDKHPQTGNKQREELLEQNVWPEDSSVGKGIWAARMTTRI